MGRRLLESRLGDGYRAYAARVPRWYLRSSAERKELRNIGLFERDSSESSAASRLQVMRFMGETLFSERGTLIAIAAVTRFYGSNSELSAWNQNHFSVLGSRLWFAKRLPQIPGRDRIDTGATRRPSSECVRIGTLAQSIQPLNRV